MDKDSFNSNYRITVYIAFKYSGGDPTKTTTYEFDDVRVLAQ